MGTLTTTGAELTVTQSNMLIEATHTLTLQEKRIVVACAAKLDPRKPLPPNGTVKLTASEFGEIFKLDKRGVYKELEAAAERLFDRRITEITDGRRGKRSKTNIRWVWMSDYRPGEGYVQLGFSPAVVPYLTMLHREFTTVQLRHLAALSSFYSVRLFELLAQYRGVGARQFGVPELRDILDLKGKYEDIKNLRVRVIDPAVKDINGNTDLRIECESIRGGSNGRKVTHFKFHITVDPQTRMDV